MGEEQPGPDGRGVVPVRMGKEGKEGVWFAEVQREEPAGLGEGLKGGAWTLGPPWLGAGRTHWALGEGTEEEETGAQTQPTIGSNK